MSRKNNKAKYRRQNNYLAVDEKERLEKNKRSNETRKKTQELKDTGRYDPSIYHMKKTNRKQVVPPVVFSRTQSARDKNAKKMERMMKKMALSGEPKTSRQKKLGMDSSDDDSSDDN